MFDPSYQEQHWPSFADQRASTSWEDNGLSYSGADLISFEPDTWQYPTPAGSDSGLLYSQLSFGAHNTPLPPAPALHTPSLQLPYTPQTTTAPFTSSLPSEKSSVSTWQQPTETQRPSSGPTSPAPHQSTSEELSRPSTSAFSEARASPSNQVDFATTTGVGAPPTWPSDFPFGDNPLQAATTSLANWPSNIMHNPLSLPPNTAGSFSTALPSFDQDRAFYLHEASASIDFNSWSQLQQQQQQQQWPQLSGCPHGTSEATSGVSDPSPFDWPALPQLGESTTPLAGMMSRTASLTGTATNVPPHSFKATQSTGTPSLSSTLGTGPWESPVSLISPWENAQPPPPELIHRNSAPQPIESHPLANLSRRSSVGSSASTQLFDLSFRSLATSTSSLETSDQQQIQNKSASNSEVSGQTTSAGSDSAAAGEQPAKVRKQRRKQNEPPRDAAQRRYACELCVDEPRMFARPSALKIHLLTHTKEKPHDCPTCHRAFAIASNLKRHMKLHRAQETKEEAARQSREAQASSSLKLGAPLSAVPSEV